MTIANIIDNFDKTPELLSLEELEETRFLFESIGVPDDFFSKLLADFCELKLLLWDEVGGGELLFADFGLEL